MLKGFFKVPLADLEGALQGFRVDGSFGGDRVYRAYRDLAGCIGCMGFTGFIGFIWFMWLGVGFQGLGLRVQG